MKNAYNIFISYHESHKPEADMLENMIAGEGVRVFRADEVTTGKMTEEEFIKYTKDAYAFIFFMSEDTKESELIEKQILFAVKNQITIIPVMLEDFELSEKMELYLSNVQIKDVQSNENTLHLAAERIHKMIDLDKSENYSIVSFFARLIGTKTKDIVKKYWEKRNVVKEKGQVVEEKTCKSITSGWIFFIVQFVVSVLFCICMYIGISSSNILSRHEKYTITIPPLVLAIVFGIITSRLLRKIKNKILVIIISIVLCVALFYIMFHMGFFIAQQNPKF